MIDRNGFWRVMGAYGAHIWPAQAVFYLAGVLVVGWLYLRPGPLQNRLAKLYLALAFGWNGIAFYLVLARDLAGESVGNVVLGALFLVVAVLLGVDLFRRRMVFALPTGWRRTVTLALTLLVFCYPLFGLALGHPALIVLGTFPCPTVALGLVLLATALPLVDEVVYVLLLIFAIPFTPFVQIARYGVYEDAILFGTGVYSLVLLLLAGRPSFTDGQHAQAEAL